MGKISLSVEVKEGKDLKVHSGKSGKNNQLPSIYIALQLGRKRKKTRTKKKTDSPVWDETFKFIIDTLGSQDELICEVFDWNSFSSDQLLSTIKIPILTLRNCKTVDKHYPLTGSISGELHLIITAHHDLSSNTNVEEQMSPPATPRGVSGASSSSFESSISEDDPTNEGVTPAIPPTVGDLSEVGKYPEATAKVQRIFGLNPGMETDVVECYHCSLKGEGTGELFVTRGYLYYYGKKRRDEHKEIIAFDDIRDFFKHSSFLIHNALNVVTSEASFIFHGFINREEAFELFRKVKAYRMKSIMYEGETPLFTAIMDNKVNEVRKLLDTTVTKEEINWQDKYGFTVLHSAVAKSDINVKILQDLLDFEGILVNIKNNDHNTPLHYFCQKFKSPDDCQEIFELILKKGGDVNARNRVGEAPLHKAMFNNAIRLLVVDLLLTNGANVNVKTLDDETPLHYAVRLNRKDLVQTLVAGGADIYCRGKRENKTAYEMAVEYDFKEMILHLKKVQDLWEWLLSIEMQQYHRLFVGEEMFLEECESIDENVLDRMGITTTGPRIKILKACQQLRIENEKLQKQKQEQEQEQQHLQEAQSKQTDAKSKDETPLKVPNKRVLQIGKEYSTKSMLHLRQTLSNLEFVRSHLNVWIEDSELEFTKKLGSGTSGKVYQGIYKGNEVAIKVMKEFEEESQIEDFKKEFQILCTIQSPEAVTFYGACLEPKLCMVMELCSHGSLYSFLRKTDMKLSWNNCFSFVIQSIAGINVLHKNDPPIIHRDVKTLNFLVTKDLKVKVCDFGLSRFNIEKNQQTMNKICGTVAYLAPEVYTGESFTTKADIFSLGIVIWEIVNTTVKGFYESPYMEFNYKFDYQILLGVTQHNQRPTLPDWCPSSLKDLIKCSVDGDPNKRPTASELYQQAIAIQEQYKLEKEEWDTLLETKRDANAALSSSQIASNGKQECADSENETEGSIQQVLEKSSEHNNEKSQIQAKTKLAWMEGQEKSAVANNEERLELNETKIEDSVQPEKRDHTKKSKKSTRHSGEKKKKRSKDKERERIRDHGKQKKEKLTISDDIIAEENVE